MIADGIFVLAYPKVFGRECRNYGSKHICVAILKIYRPNFTRAVLAITSALLLSHKVTDVTDENLTNNFLKCQHT